MGKQLLIIRHAKSDWGNAGLRDFDRPLNKRGKANAPEMAARLVMNQIKPDLMVSSPALRAITTAGFFAEVWNIPNQKIQKDSTIYEAGVRALLTVVNGLPNEYNKVALFGHNPGLTDLANYFDGHIDNMPTCSVLLLEFPFDDWKMVSADTGKVLLFDYPKSGED
jgi:phosphohistidine phosphatase